MAILLGFLYFFYENQQLCVKWGNRVSVSITVSMGVRHVSITVSMGVRHVSITVSMGVRHVSITVSITVSMGVRHVSILSPCIPGWFIHPTVLNGCNVGW